MASFDGLMETQLLQAIHANFNKYEFLLQLHEDEYQHEKGNPETSRLIKASIRKYKAKLDALDEVCADVFKQTPDNSEPQA